MRRDVAGVGRDPPVLVVDHGQAGAVRRPSTKPRADALGPHDEMGRHRQVAVDALAFGQRGHGRPRHVRAAPDGNAPPAGLGREEVPVAHRVARDGVGDVVRGEREAVDPELDLARSELGERLLGEAGAPQVVAANFEARGRGTGSLLATVDP